MLRLLENNDRLNMHSAERHLGFSILSVFGGVAGTAGGAVADDKQDEKTAQAQATAEVWMRFKFPPIDCADAQTKIEQLEALVKSTQEQIASTTTNRVGRRYLSSYQQVGTAFKNWFTANKCEATQIAEQNAADNANLLDTINGIYQDSDSKGTVDNWIVYGVLGILAVGATIIIVKS